MPKLSVIVPIYNGEKYLGHCLNSVLRQSLTDIEVICVNDGSDDSSLDILNSYASKDERIVIISKDNGGLVSARKVGMSIATCEYVTFIDCDDWIDETMYESMVGIMDAAMVDCVIAEFYEEVAGSSFVRKSVFRSGYYDKKLLLRDVYPSMIFHQDLADWGGMASYCNKIFKRSILDPILSTANDKVDLNEDQIVVFPYLLASNSVYFMNEPFYHYRQHLASMSRSERSVEVERDKYKQLFESLDKKLCEYIDVFDAREQWRKRILWMMMQRADILYDGMEQLDFLFPYPNVKRGANIILYGAGRYGERLYKFLVNNNFCSVVAWLDRNYEAIRCWGLPVKSPDIIDDLTYDAIVIAVTFPHVSKAIFDELKKLCSEDKIHRIDSQTIFSVESMHSFRLK